MPPSARLPLLATCLVGLAGVDASALLFTVTATVTYDDTGVYGTGTPVEFTYAVDPDFDPAFAIDSYGATSLAWVTDTTEHSPLWKGLTGTALTGQWVLPDNNPSAPYDSLSATYANDRLGLLMGSDTNEPLGVLVGPYGLRRLQLSASYTGLDLTDPGSATDPFAYFADLAGTYPVASTSTATFHTTAGYIGLSLQSLTITIPEPARLAAALPFAVGLLALARRRPGRRDPA